MKRILIIGAGLLQSYIIRKSKEIGLYTICIDGDKNAIGYEFADEYCTIDITDYRKCFEYAKEKKIDGVVTGASDYGVITCSYIAKKLNLKGLDLNVAKLIKNKYEVRKQLSKLTNLEFYGVDSEHKLKKVLDNAKRYPFIVKPSDGSGSKGVKKVYNKEELEEAYFIAINNSLANRVIIEEFINANEYGVESFVLNGEIEILGIMRKRMTKEPYYSELGHSIPSLLSEEVEKKVINLVKKTIRILDINYGSVNMDILIDDKFNINIIDIGARMGGNLIGSHIIPKYRNEDYIEKILLSALGEEVRFKNNNKGKVISSRILNLDPGNVVNTSIIEKKYWDVYDLVFKLSKGDKINEYRNNLDGCGYVVAEMDDVIEAEKYLDNIRDEINEEVRKEEYV